MLFSEFTIIGLQNQSTNDTFILLVLKRTQTKKISNFRLISFATSFYKILVKVLSKHIQRVLRETIYVSQGAFIERRQI